MKKNRIVIILAIVVIVIVGDLILFGNISPNKSNLKKLRAAMDIDNPITRKFSLQLASAYPGEYNIDQICKIYNHIYKNWKYVNDPRGTDYLSKASQTIESNLTGDCDDFAILIATAIESIGGRTRISFASNASGGHAFTEVYFADDPQKLYDRINYHFQGLLEYIFDISKVKKINYRTDRVKGYWLNLDYTSKYPGGTYYDFTRCTIFYPKENYYTSE
jgi:hypothetical protein